ncbi:TPA: hypothetical protein EYG59_11765 [Candidatus Poribacteria bacterium]|nr:hypothetical protein [Candidatus Poribacteria bacterium]
MIFVLSISYSKLNPDYFRYANGHPSCVIMVLIDSKWCPFLPDWCLLDGRLNSDDASMLRRPSSAISQSVGISSIEWYKTVLLLHLTITSFFTTVPHQKGCA